MMQQYTPSQLAAHQAQKERQARLGFGAAGASKPARLKLPGFAAPGTNHDIIKSVVGEYYGVSVEDIASYTQAGEAIPARAAAIHIAAVLHPYQSPSQIGSHFGGRKAEAVTRISRGVALAIKSDLVLAQTIRMLFDWCGRAISNRPTTPRAAIRAPKPFYVSASYRAIQTIVADYFAISLEDLIGANATRKHALPRHVAVYIAAKAFPSHSLRRVGELFAGRDHATIHHAIERIKKLTAADVAFAAVVEGLLQECLVAVGCGGGAPINADG